MHGNFHSFHLGGFAFIAAEFPRHGQGALGQQHSDAFLVEDFFHQIQNGLAVAPLECHADLIFLEDAEFVEIKGVGDANPGRKAVDAVGIAQVVGFDNRVQVGGAGELKVPRAVLAGSNRVPREASSGPLENVEWVLS
jgi:hypothetical protein